MPDDYTAQMGDEIVCNVTVKKNHPCDWQILIRMLLVWKRWFFHLHNGTKYDMNSSFIGQEVEVKGTISKINRIGHYGIDDESFQCSDDRMRERSN